MFTPQISTLYKDAFPPVTKLPVFVEVTHKKYCLDYQGLYNGPACVVFLLQIDDVSLQFLHDLFF